MTLVKKLNYIFTKKQKIRLTQIMVLIIIGSILETVGVTIILPFINAIMYPEKLLESRWIQTIYELLHLENSNEFIIVMAIVLVLIYLLKNAYMVLMYNAQYKFVYNNQKRLADQMMACYMKEPYTFHLSHNSSELIHNLVVDVDTFYIAILNGILLLTEAVVCITLGIVLLIFDPTITVGVTLFTGVFALLFVKLYQKRLGKLGRTRRVHEIATTKWAQQALGGIKETKIVNRENFFLKHYEQDYEQFVVARRKAATYGAFPKPVMETVSIVALMGIIVIKLLSGVDAEYFITTLSVFAVAVFRIMPSVSKLLAYLNAVMFNKSAIDALYHDMKEVEGYEQAKFVREDQNTNITFEHAITLQDICFRYPGSERYILKHANLVLTKNQSIALIGPSGAGKTTLADIILGILPVESGKLLIDQYEVQSGVTEWKGFMGYIPQTIYLMDDTIRNNIAYAIQEDLIDETRIWKALEEAQLKEYVEGLEEGLDTYIGERGVRLSGGQRQRLGIARVLYDDPQVLVFDEATSALDTATETAVMEAIDALNGKKTIIIIAHRLSTIEKCNVTYEIKDGQATRR